MVYLYPHDEGRCSFSFVSNAFSRRVSSPSLLFLLSLSFSLVLSAVFPQVLHL